MKKIIPVLLITMFSFTLPQRSNAWGAEGHHFVAEVAFHFLDSATQAKVKKYLGGLTIEEAATWMDDMRSNDFYSYMRVWHYIDVSKGLEYNPGPKDQNALVILNAVINDLKNDLSSTKKRDVKVGLYVLFHLIGDMHQPLHTGYPEDRGGNDVTISLLKKGNTINLHGTWDYGIIENQKITLADCLKQYDSLSADDITRIRKISPFQWYRESRSYLDTVYDFKDNFLDQAYVDKAIPIIEKQILFAGMRLAAVLEEVFKDVQ